MTADPGRVALRARLNDLALLATLVGIGAILTAAMILQYADGEVPCPLCLLQRVALFGVCLGIVRHFRDGYSARNTGLSLLWTLFLQIVSVRQVLLNIYARPGHAYPGSAVLGLHMPVWSVLIAFALLVTFAVELAVFGNEGLHEVPPMPLTTKVGWLLSHYLTALCAINLVSALLQCGFGECHTTGYTLL